MIRLNVRFLSGTQLNHFYTYSLDKSLHFVNTNVSEKEGGHLLPGDLVLGYIFDFCSRQAALTTTSFDKKSYQGILLAVSR